MRCSEVQLKIPEYEAGALSPAEQDAVAAHLAGCAPCNAELEGLARCLRALEAAAPAEAPDLWASFQARLAQETGECERVADLLPAYAADELDAAETGEVREHLALCGPCAGESESLARSLAALRRAAEPAPDLWPAYQQRLGRELSCGEARERIFAYLDGAAAGPDEWALSAHFAACEACAAEAAAYRRAEGVLARVGSARPVVDLWPQFQARLEAERERRGWEVPVPAGLAGVLRSPAWRPAAAFAAAAVLFWLAAGRLGTPAARPAAPQLAQAPVEPVRPAEPVTPDGEPPVKPQPKHAAPAPKAPRRTSVARVRPRRRTPAAAVRKAPVTGRRPEAPVVLARQTPPPAPPAEAKRWGGLTVAFNPDIAAPEAPAEPAGNSASPSTMSGDMERAVKSDFVRFANVIEEIRDVASDPLGNDNEAK